MPMRLLQWGRKMPSTKLYNLVPNDEFDTRIPLHPDEAFQYGITFNAKYIGTLDVPRPTSRVEIVAAMRRVRYEFKAKGVKKRKVTVNVSTDGVRVTTRKSKNKCKNNASVKLFGRSSKNVVNDDGMEIMHHPIYRIFYVSHDSSDLKIFSYIARDGATNVFKCNVFKSNRKSQAMRIVRTVGQAFEVCHKMQNNPDNPAPSTSSTTDHGSDAPALKDMASDCVATVTGVTSTMTVCVEPELKGESSGRPNILEYLPPPPRKESKRSPRTTPTPSVTLPDLPEFVTKVPVEVANVDDGVLTPFSAQHQLQLLRERLEQQAQQTRAAVAQLLLLRDQLAAEQAARCEAQARTHQLLVHNKELLEHIAALVVHLKERDRGSSKPISAHQLTMLPQTSTIGNQIKDETPAVFNGKRERQTSDPIIDVISQTNKVTQNMENNNIGFSPFKFPKNVQGLTIDGLKPALTFGEMTANQIETYFISQFENMGGCVSPVHEQINDNTSSKNQQFFQNCNAFPGIPPLSNHYSNIDTSSVVNHQVYEYKDRDRMTEECAAHNQSMFKGPSQTSLCSNSQSTTCKDSSPEATSSDDVVPFIMPLSHKGTLTAKDEDGKVRLIVPVSPSESSTNVLETDRCVPNGRSEMNLKVAFLDRLNPAGPIYRTTSEKVPNKSEMMTALRAQWTRHTTK